MLPLCNSIGLMLLLYLGWELCVVTVVYNYYRPILSAFLCASPIFQTSEVNTLLSKHCSHKWLWEITILLYMRSTHCTSRKCVYRVTVGVSIGIINNLLLSRAYFPHLFHIISAKAKKLQLLSENLQEVAAVGWAYCFPFAEVRPRSEVNTCGSDLTLGSHTGACGNVA